MTQDHHWMMINNLTYNSRTVIYHNMIDRFDRDGWAPVASQLAYHWKIILYPAVDHMAKKKLLRGIIVQAYIASIISTHRKLFSLLSFLSSFLTFGVGTLWTLDQAIRGLSPQGQWIWESKKRRTRELRFYRDSCHILHLVVTRQNFYAITRNLC